MEDMDDFLEYVDNVDQDEDINVVHRLDKRYIRDMQDPFRFYEDNEFIKRYRFRKASVMDVLLPLVFNRLAKNNNRGLPIAPVIQLLIALIFYETGNFQLVNGDLRGISPSTVSLVIKRISVALAENLRNFVKFPVMLHEQEENIMKFYNVANFPNVAACVDCTHITIGNSGGEIGEIFRNRKRQFSLNVQVASGPNIEILDIDVRYPGSTHDIVIFDRSALRVRFETRQIEGTGAWNRRFPCLRRVLLTKLETSVAVICATAVLYNIARNIQEDDFKDNNNELPPEDNIIIEANDDGLAFRGAFIAIHFQ
ncbi:hypothetical protein NQ314_016222 [Rhamnusium bicolor]|uniref:DDE Tnp4 domain-containing protein n=1 Tax=Rhamnusium bicolor TaxID=1586634 RepID=A0AAV8WW52_9CUCU|nr:hypothetical protein NQ314_016222 [Rhamnusium bicolor]